MPQHRASTLTLQPLEGIPLVAAGTDLAAVIDAALAEAGLVLQDGDILVIAQKIVSKAEGRSVALATVEPTPRAIEIAAAAHKDPRLVELILRESNEVLRVRPGVIVVENKAGVVLANAGVDRSNVADDEVLLLPIDADASAADLREDLGARLGVDLGVLIIDSIGRAWRNGTVGTCIGASGITTLLDLRGKPDLYGRRLETTEVGWADELAAAASLVMGQADEGLPVVVARGAVMKGEGTAKGLLRDKNRDLFR